MLLDLTGPERAAMARGRRQPPCGSAKSSAAKNHALPPPVPAGAILILSMPPLRRDCCRNMGRLSGRDPLPAHLFAKKKWPVVKRAPEEL